MTEANRPDESKKLSHFERKYQDQLSEVGNWFSQLMRTKLDFYKSASKDGLTPEQIESALPPEVRGTWEDILDRFLPEEARRKK